MSEPICTYGHHPIGSDEYFYVVNPEGGYARHEVLICEKCLPDFPEVNKRLVETGVKTND